MSDGDERVETAPEGSTCRKHPERAAIVICPRCGDPVCISCWHGPQGCCHTCLLRDRTDPVPWADPSRGFLARFVATVGGIFSPTADAVAFTQGAWQRGVSFALLTAIPLAMLGGIIPFTHTLRFGPSGATVPIGTPSGADFAMDIGQAMAIGLLLGAAKLLLLGAPYVSLGRAYGAKLESQPTRQAVLYRGWLLLLGGQHGLLLGIVVWLLPTEPGGTLLLVGEVVSLLPLMLLFFSLSAAARVAGVGPFAALLVVVIPFIVVFLAENTLIELLAPLLPDAETVRESVDQSAAIVKLGLSIA